MDSKVRCSPSGGRRDHLPVFSQGSGLARKLLHIYSCCARITASLLVCVTTLAFAPIAHAQDSAGPEGKLVREIRVNVRVPSSAPPGFRVSQKDRRAVFNALRASMKTRKGEPYSAEILDKDVKRIAGRGRFWINAKVVPAADGVVLEIDVTLRPVVEKVAFVDKQGKKMGASDELLLEIITEEGKYFSRYFLLHDSGIIDEYYRSRGYPFASTKGRAEFSAEGVEIKFTVDRGPYVVIRSISFRNNKFFNDKKLYARLKTHATVQNFWRSLFIVPDAKYIRKDVEEGIETLLRAYRDEGYLDARVWLESVRFSRDKREVFITIAVEEGERYLIESIEIDGNKAFSTETLTKKLAAAPGSPYRQETLDKDTESISEVYEENAYIYFRVEPRISYGLDGSKVKLTYKIFEGPQIYLEKLKIEGNYRTRDRVIRREISIHPGEKLDTREWRKSLQRLVNLQFFEGLQTTLEDTDDPARKTIVAQVAERKTGQMNFGFSYSTALGLQGFFQLSQKNFDFTDLPKSFEDFFSGRAFAGDGKYLAFTLQPGRSHSNYGVTYRDPHLSDSDTRLSVNLHYQDHEYVRWDERREGINIGLGRSLSRRFVVDLLYRFEVNTLTNISPSSPIDVFMSAGTKNLSAIRPVLKYSTVDLDIHLTRYAGHYVQVSYEYAGGFMGGEVDFSAASASVGVYKKLFEDSEGYKHVISLDLSGDWKEPHHNTVIIPWYERFFLGGSGTLRGFEYRGAGPKEGRDFIGGNVRATASLEYSMPLPISKEYFRGVLFVDSGNLAPDVNSFLLRDFRLSAGFGLRIRAGNMFVFVMDFGYPLIRFKGDERRTFHFSFGTEF